MTEVLARDQQATTEVSGRPAPRSSTHGPVSPVRRWQRLYVARLLTADVLAVVVAALAGVVLRFGDLGASPLGINYVLTGLIVSAVWLVSLYAAKAYDVRHIGLGVQEIKRIAQGAAVTVGAVATACYVIRVDIARGYVAIVLPLALVLTVVGRRAVRRHVRAQRRRGEWSQRIVVVGSAASVLDVVTATKRRFSAGLRVVGACVDGLEPGTPIAPGVPVVGAVADVRRATEEVGADVVAVAAEGVSAQNVRAIAWSMEGSGCVMALAPALTEVAGTRVSVSPIEGLPLMWVEQPQFTGFSRVLKRAVDIAGAGLGLLVLSPLLTVVAVLVKRTPGPVLFRQSRLGINGEPFQVLKFRSMVDGAEAQRVDLLEHNENDGGVLFKIKADPRITPVGKVLRRLSIDELPQLWNVLRGEMSLVGPRPLATEDSAYDGHARRRLLVKPGMTGLWQVSGRSDLAWDDAVRLDLYYVENWSLALDVSIIAKTVNAVVRSSGAY